MICYLDIDSKLYVIWSQCFLQTVFCHRNIRKLPKAHWFCTIFSRNRTEKNTSLLICVLLQLLFRAILPLNIEKRRGIMTRGLQQTVDLFFMIVQSSFKAIQARGHQHALRKWISLASCIAGRHTFGPSKITSHFNWMMTSGPGIVRGEKSIHSLNLNLPDLGQNPQ